MHDMSLLEKSNLINFHRFKLLQVSPRYSNTLSQFRDYDSSRIWQTSGTEYGLRKQR